MNFEALAGFVERRPLEVGQALSARAPPACCSQTGSSRLTVLPSSGRWLRVAGRPLAIVRRRAKCLTRRNRSDAMKFCVITALWLQNTPPSPGEGFLVSYTTLALFCFAFFFAKKLFTLSTHRILTPRLQNDAECASTQAT